MKASAGREAPLEQRAEMALVARAQRGDAQAFESIYRLYVGRTYALCLRMSADPVRAETLTQDVFVRAWRKLPSFAGRGAFGAWLRRLAVNVVIQDHRAARRERNWLESFPDAEQGQEGVGLGLEAAGGVSGSLATDYRERVNAANRTDFAIDLERAIAGLPPGARLAFVLHDVEGYQHQEIADMTGLAAGTIKAQVHRARSLLRTRLNSVPPASGDEDSLKEP